MKTKQLKGRGIIHSLLTVMLSAVFLFGCENTGNETGPDDTAVDELSSDVDARQDSPAFTSVDDPPTPEDGIHSFFQYISRNLKYPEEAREQGIEGKVFIKFVVTKDGSISNVEVDKGVGYGMDEEAMRVIAAYDKKWKPGILKGEAVNTKMILPITYALKDKYTE